MSNEFFYLDDDGKRSDAALHDVLLDNDDADLANRVDTALRAVADGSMTPVTAAELYGVDADWRFWTPIYEGHFLDTVNMIGLGEAHLIKQIKRALETDTKIPEPPDNMKI